MNIQIFGLEKSFDTKKAMRFFKERNISFQFVDFKIKYMSKREFLSVVETVKDLESCLERTKKNEELFLRFQYMPQEDKLDFVLEHQELLKLPVVRNQRKATFGYAPEVWKSWIEA